MPTGPDSGTGFTVLEIEPERVLVLGTLLDLETRERLPFDAPLPERYWRGTWAFSLHESASGGTLLLVRARTDFQPDWMQPFHNLLAAPTTASWSTDSSPT